MDESHGVPGPIEKLFARICVEVGGVGFMRWVIVVGVVLEAGSKNG